MGWLYETGRSVDQDLDRAFFFYDKSAIQGNVFGMKYMAILLLKGRRGLLGRLLGGVVFSKIYSFCYLLRCA